MTDRELLELAAKSIGRTIRYNYLGGMDANDPWNPLKDDGDAFRLAVEHGLYLEIDRPNQRARALPELDEMEFSSEPFKDDRCSAMRRAITRAAAKIGKEMK